MEEMILQILITKWVKDSQILNHLVNQIWCLLPDKVGNLQVWIINNQKECKYLRYSLSNNQILKDKIKCREHLELEMDKAKWQEDLQWVAGKIKCLVDLEWVEYKVKCREDLQWVVDKAKCLEDPEWVVDKAKCQEDLEWDLKQIFRIQGDHKGSLKWIWDNNRWIWDSQGYLNNPIHNTEISNKFLILWVSNSNITGDTK